MMNVGRTIGWALGGAAVVGGAAAATAWMFQHAHTADAPTSDLGGTAPSASPTTSSPVQPDPGPVDAAPAPTPTKTPAPDPATTPVPDPATTPVPVTVATPAAPDASSTPAATYTVKPGDTLTAIAATHATTVELLVALNHIAKSSQIRVGQVLQLAAGTPAPSTPSAPITPPRPGSKGKVALTFDDGPNGATTDAILAVLARHQVHATFFVIGEQASAGASRLRKERDAGHVIGNHTWDHQDLTKLGNDAIASELSRTQAAIKAVTGTAPTLFRAPYGARNSRVDGVAAQQGLPDIIWDVDTVDWSRPGTDSIAAHAINDARAGSIVLMHDGGGDRSQTVAALDRVITGLQARGFDLVTVPELSSN